MTVSFTGHTPEVPWVVETIDEDAQTAVDIAIDESNRVHICYFVNTGSGTSLRYATGIPLLGPGWTIETIDGVGEASDCAIETGSDGHVHVAYVADGELRYARRDEGAWPDWVVEPSDVDGTCSIALDLRDAMINVPYISYRTLEDRYRLYWAYGEGGTWFRTFIRAGNPDVGFAAYHDIAFDNFYGTTWVTYNTDWSNLMLHKAEPISTIEYPLDFSPLPVSPLFSHRLGTINSLFKRYAIAGLDDHGFVVLRRFDIDSNTPGLDYWDEPYYSRVESFASSVPESYEGRVLSLATSDDNSVHIAYYDLDTGLRYFTTRHLLSLNPCFASIVGYCTMYINQRDQITEQVYAGIGVTDAEIEIDSERRINIAYLAQEGGTGPPQLRFARETRIFEALPCLSPLRWRFYYMSMLYRNIRSFVISNKGREDLVVEEVRIESIEGDPNAWGVQLDCDDEFRDPTASPISPGYFRAICVGFWPTTHERLHTATLSVETNAGTVTAELIGEIVLTFTAYSPVNLTVKNPEDLIIDNQTNNIPGASYTETDLNDDGEPDDRIAFQNPKMGHYEVSLVPEPDALGTETYTLVAQYGPETLTIAENVPVSDIPQHPYIVLVTEEGIYIELCDGTDDECNGAEADADGDGYSISEGDCDDTDSTVYPGAPGTFKGKDNNCNKIIENREKIRAGVRLVYLNGLWQLQPPYFHSQQPPWEFKKSLSQFHSPPWNFQKLLWQFQQQPVLQFQQSRWVFQHPWYQFPQLPSWEFRKISLQQQ